MFVRAGLALLVIAGGPAITYVVISATCFWWLAAGEGRCGHNTFTAAVFTCSVVWAFLVAVVVNLSWWRTKRLTRRCSGPLRGR